MNSIRDDLKSFIKALGWYFRLKVSFFALKFEGLKNFTVELLMQKRGAHQKRFWHGAMIALCISAVVTSGVFGGQSLISSSFPGIGGPDPRFATSFEPFPNGVLFNPEAISGFDTHTIVSEKPRSGIIEYKVENGDTLSSIASKFGISTDTIKWANNITDVNQIKPGQTIKILPVTGVSYVVKTGDTLASIAKKFSGEQQAILDFPFNDVPDDFSLKVGQLLIVPDGSPQEIVVPRPRRQFLAQGPATAGFSAPGGGIFSWPARGIITQYYAWYHPGNDIANSSAPPITASDGGVIVYAGWDPTGYGNKIDINHGNGYITRYAHMSNIYVTSGQSVSRGQLIGQMGSTGRSTGTHLHFEIHFKGIPVNPLSILR